MAVGSLRRSSARRFAWYFRFQLGLRDIEELLFERGVIVSYETSAAGATNSVQASHIALKQLVANLVAHRILTRFFVTLRGEPYLLWRAFDQHGAELDILRQKSRDKAAAKRFFKRVLAACPNAPRRIGTDQLRSYPAAKAEIPELANVKHVFVKAGARVNNRAEHSHQPTRERERRLRGLRLPERTRAFLSCFGPIRQHFALKRHLLRASLYRKQLSARFDVWRFFTGVAQSPSATS